MRTRKKLSNNAARRAEQRDADKAARDRERVARLEPGGDPARPLDVPSASVVEVQALGITCLVCFGAYRLEEHTAEVISEKRLRVVRLRCKQCGRARALFFRIVAPLPN